MDLNRLKNICTNSNNTHIYSVVETTCSDISIFSRSQSLAIEEIVSHIRLLTVYTRVEVNDILRDMGATGFKFQDDPKTCVSVVCKFKTKVFNIKMLYPADGYVIGGGPWKVSPNTMSDHAYKEARKLSTYLNASFPYKHVNLDLEEYTERLR